MKCTQSVACVGVRVLDETPRKSSEGSYWFDHLQEFGWLAFGHVAASPRPLVASGEVEPYFALLVFVFAIFRVRRGPSLF